MRVEFDETSSCCAEEHSKYYETFEEFYAVLTFHSFESLHFCFFFAAAADNERIEYSSTLADSMRGSL